MANLIVLQVNFCVHLPLKVMGKLLENKND
jgi:hypothetical protein